MFKHDEIRNSLSVPHPDKPGYLKHDRHCTYQEVINQLEAFLKGLDVPQWGHNAHGGAEYISTHSVRHKLDIPCIGNLVAVPRFGGCEGYLIELMVIVESEYKPIATIKFLSDMDVVWKIAQSMAVAINEGRFN